MLFIDEVLAEDPDHRTLKNLFLKDAIVYKVMNFDPIFTEKDKKVLSKLRDFTERNRLIESEYNELYNAPKDNFEPFFRKVHEKVMKRFPEHKKDSLLKEITKGFVEICIEKPPSRQPFPFIVISDKDSFIVSFEDLDYLNQGKNVQEISRIVQHYSRSNKPELINGQLKKSLYVQTDVLIYLYQPEKQIMVDSIYQFCEVMIEKSLKEDGVSDKLIKEMLPDLVKENAIQKIKLILKTNRLFSLLTCKNVEAVDKNDSLTKKQRKQGKKDPITYKEIKITVPRIKTQISLNSILGDNQVGLHQCPGHYRTYTEEAPLFGKIVGTFWIPPHTRGNREKGININRYDIRTD